MSPHTLLLIYRHFYNWIPGKFLAKALLLLPRGQHLPGEPSCELPDRPGLQHLLRRRSRVAGSAGFRSLHQRPRRKKARSASSTGGGLAVVHDLADA